MTRQLSLVTRYLKSMCWESQMMMYWIWHLFNFISRLILESWITNQSLILNIFIFSLVWIISTSNYLVLKSSTIRNILVEIDDINKWIISTYYFFVLKSFTIINILVITDDINKFIFLLYDSYRQKVIDNGNNIRRGRIKR